MPTIPIEEAQVKLPELIDRLAIGEEVELTRGGCVVARIVRERSQKGRRPGPGLGKGMLTVFADDNEHLNAFAEYMP